MCKSVEESKQTFNCVYLVVYLTLKLNSLGLMINCFSKGSVVAKKFTLLVARLFITDFLIISHFSSNLLSFFPGVINHICVFISMVLAVFSDKVKTL